MSGRPRKGITFWDRVYSQVLQRGECIEFTGCKDDCGYGRINKDGKLVRVHRAVYERDHGAIPLGLVIRHKCDNPACINPLHLEAGTQAENIADMDRRGRRVTIRGGERTTRMLSVSDVREIRSLLGAGFSCTKVAARFGVTDAMIGHIKHGRAWRHVA
jgi:hypothetical protein